MKTAPTITHVSKGESIKSDKIILVTGRKILGGMKVKKCEGFRTVFPLSFVLFRFSAYLGEIIS